MDELKDLITKRVAVMDLSIDNNLLEYITDEVVQKVKNYTNQTTLPKGLYYLVAKMVVSSASSYGIPKEDMPEETPNLTASSIKVGDMTVQLKSVAPNTSDIDANVSKVLNDYYKELNAFRRIKW